MSILVLLSILFCVIVFIVEIAFILYGILEAKYKKETEPKIYKVQINAAKEEKQNKEKIEKKEKTLVLYVTHEYNANTEYFLKRGIFKSDYIDFYFIFNNKYQDVELPEYVHYMKRNNFGFDFGGWSDALLTNDFYKSYDKFLFLNSSVMGPFLPEYFKGEWPTIFTNKLKDNIKLQGITINVKYDKENPHVQSFCFCMNKETLEYLITKEIFTQKKYPLVFADAIDREIQMSYEILNYESENWNIASMLKEQDKIDWHNYPKGINDEDPTWQNKYHNQSLNPYLSIFVKTTHNRLDKEYLDLIQKIY
jgi:hypothetical protein